MVAYKYRVGGTEAPSPPVSVLEAIAALPPGLRAVLADGPSPGVNDCRICTFLGPILDAGGLGRVSKDVGVILRWHVRHLCFPEPLPYGPITRELSMESYRRCCAIYRAAGWDG